MSMAITIILLLAIGFAGGYWLGSQAPRADRKEMDELNKENAALQKALNDVRSKLYSAGYGKQYPQRYPTTVPGSTASSADFYDIK